MVSATPFELMDLITLVANRLSLLIFLVHVVFGSSNDLHPIRKALIKKAGLTQKTAQTGSVTLIQRFDSALNLNVHFHMLFLDGIYTKNKLGLRI